MPHGCVNAVGTTISVSEIIGKSLHVVDIGVSGCVDVELSTDWTSAAAGFSCIFTSDEYGVGHLQSNPAQERVTNVQFVFTHPIFFFPWIGTFLRICVPERQ